MNDGLQMKYFVLKPRGDDDHAEASRCAMDIYADYIALTDPALATGLRLWVAKEKQLAKAKGARDDD
jgi:hypothetical protein